MAYKPGRISPAQVVYGAFPGAVRFLGNQMNRVIDIVNPEGERKDPLSLKIRQEVVLRMNSEFSKISAHEQARRERFESRRLESNDTDPTRDVNKTDLILPDLFDLKQGDESPDKNVSRTTSISLTVRDVSLIEVNSGSSVRTEVFPRSVHCQRCSHFLILDPERPPRSMTCPCCRKGQLVVEPIVFICGRCAAFRELTPPGEKIAGRARRKNRRIGESKGLQPQCPDCGKGHIHLEKHGTNSVARWQWTCTHCSHYKENVQELCSDCSLPKTAKDTPDFIFMQAIPAAASNALQPLTYEEIFVGPEKINISSLHIRSGHEFEEWEDAFSLKHALEEGAVSEADASSLRASCLLDAFLVDNVRVFTTTYGCKPGGISRHPQTPVESEDRLAHFFRDPEGISRYCAYCISTQGAALVLSFDPTLIIERLSSRLNGHSDSLQNLVRKEASTAAHLSIRDLLRIEGDTLAIYRSLHALEHALLGAAMQQIGNESLGSRLFAAEATVVIFERTNIGRGGVVQLVNRGPGLRSLFDAARDNMLGCAQGCVDGCPACAYVKDAYCIQPTEFLGQSWVPPNSLLSRRGAARILSPEED